MSPGHEQVDTLFGGHAHKVTGHWSQAALHPNPHLTVARKEAR
jgi:hypothetical protein